MQHQREIAVVGAGISGLTTAYALTRDGRHDVALFEREPEPGGHVRTETVAAPGGPIGVDTGFIVYNERTYPRFSRLLAELGVATQPSDMSMSAACAACGIDYSTRGLRGMFTRPGALTSPSHLGMLRDLFRFYGDARRTLDGGGAGAQTLGDYLASRGFGRSLPEPFPGAAHRRRVVDGARVDPRVPR